MNLVEIYIKEIHSEKEMERKSCMAEKYVEVDSTIDSCGNCRRTTMHFPKSFWEGIKEDGYFMG
mgnify:CR=1 FL=1